ncbi:MAG: outer membrane lipoprotein-sorting protein [Terracidiphilus sp.]|nr:outer membrane lipoprotein-sorting protein [Terracidiphilus sp.]MDR3796637.1 outer membrane lipoprotein-sorting protein [Terracidiphilus sp.]
MTRIMKALRAAGIAALAPLLCAQTVNLKDLVASMRKRIETADFRATGHLVWVQPSGARLSYPITIKAHWFPGVLREWIEITDASKAGNGTAGSAHRVSHLLLEMRPGGQSSVTIAHTGDKSATALTFERWRDGLFGPEFGYEDLLEQQFFWAGQASEGNAKFGARDCVIVKSTPGPADRTHYAQVKTWLDPSIAFPVYVEKTENRTGLVKEFTYYGIRHEEGVWSAHQIEVKIHGQSGSTLLILDRGSAKANLTLADFNPALLTKF